MKTFYRTSLIALLIAIVHLVGAQDKDKEKDKDHFAGLKFRNIGPAFTSGRIADIAIHPTNENVWYIAAGSGGVWKTVNAGTTWTPLFDKQSTYSIGCVTIDPNNSSTIWVGTGENVGGRHVGFGDGIYVSNDEGKSWKNKGLTKSEHISKIIVHPTDPNTLWVAVQGPLWNKGGERGVYKSINGGKSWKKTLGDNEWVGATDLLIHPNNPKILYAATWQRHRTVAAYMGSGPGSGIHKSTDGGDTWEKLTNGIPEGSLGKIGLAMSYFDPEVVYAAVEITRTDGGLFMTSNGGMSWNKQSEVISGGTGPHYYQELYTSPHHNGKLYFMNNMVKISDDHGKTFYGMNEKNKHVDSHAMAFKKSDPNYVLFGTDGGLYESYDLTNTWKQIANLPLTQYYKIAVDDAEPFYHVYGGTQDNGSHGGPSRTKSAGGITNADWWVTLLADGHQSATEPGNPDITYGEFQEGWLWRIDQTTGEIVFIQPQPREGEPYERYNWDAPILVSPHNPQRLYFASQRVWKSENRGDDWTPISKDLTKNQERFSLNIMGNQQSIDIAWDVAAMSNYNTITSLAESPKQEGLIYAGTDDGIVQVTENGGTSWRKLSLGNIKGVPATAFVNDIRADLYDPNTVYIALDNHKYGDYKPYLLKSTDRGTTWTFINGNLPKKLLTWRLVQDHIDKNFIFAATEFGIYFTKNGGIKWHKLTGNLPTISFRDIHIQRRENDLVAGSFGRGIFILDDITTIRNFSIENTKKPLLFPVKNTYGYVQIGKLYGQGDAAYQGDNAPFGATLTYFLPEKLKSIKEKRKESEKEKTKQKSPIPFPGWDNLDKEKNQEDPQILLTITDENGTVVNTIKGTNEKGFNRVNWKLDFADRSGVKLNIPKPTEEYFSFNEMVNPGEYTATMYQVVDGEVTLLSTPQKFSVIPLEKGALEGASSEQITAFRKQYRQLERDLNATQMSLGKSLKKINAYKRALQAATTQSSELTKQIHDSREKLLSLNAQLNGSPTKNRVGEKIAPSPSSAGFIGVVALSTSTYGPTGTHKASVALAVKQLNAIKSALKKVISDDFALIRQGLKNAGAPWVEGDDLD